MLRPVGPLVLLLLTLLVGGGLVSDCAEAQAVYPVGGTIFQLDYDLTYHAALSAQDLRSLPAIGPTQVSQLLTGSADIRLNPAPRLFDRVAVDNVRLFAIATEQYQGRRDQTARDLFSGIVGARYQFSHHLDATVMFQLDREKATDPTYTGGKWRGLAGELETAALYYSTERLLLTLGRQRVYWGPKPANLILNATAPPMDLFSVDFNRGRLGFHFLFARLDRSRPDSTDLGRFPEYEFARDNRYFVGHRLEIRLHRTLLLGLFETSVFGGEGRTPEMYYLNPLQFFHGAQLNEGTDDNTILGLDLTWLPCPGWGLHGQLIIDDFQIDDQVLGDQEPNEIGLMAGVTRTGPMGSWRPDVSLEYVRITNRTYHQLHARNRYLYRNQPLGHPLGPDADSLSIAFKWWPDTRQTIALELAYTRHGEGSLHVPWTEPWLEAEGDYSEPFPTGVVEKGFGLQIGWRGYLPLMDYTSKHLFVSIKAGYADFENRSNVEGDNSIDAWLNLSLTWLGMIELGTGD